MDVNSQILYAEMEWDEMEKAESGKKRLNNVKHVSKAIFCSTAEVKTLNTCTYRAPAAGDIILHET